MAQPRVGTGGCSTNCEPSSSPHTYVLFLPHIKFWPMKSSISDTIVLNVISQWLLTSSSTEPLLTIIPRVDLNTMKKILSESNWPLPSVRGHRVGAKSSRSVGNIHSYLSSDAVHVTSLKPEESTLECRVWREQSYKFDFQVPIMKIAKGMDSTRSRSQ